MTFERSRRGWSAPPRPTRRYLVFNGINKKARKREKRTVAVREPSCGVAITALPLPPQWTVGVVPENESCAPGWLTGSLRCALAHCARRCRRWCSTRSAPCCTPPRPCSTHTLSSSCHAVWRRCAASSTSATPTRTARSQTPSSTPSRYPSTAAPPLSVTRSIELTCDSPRP
jgi:hypothetical protein